MAVTSAGEEVLGTFHGSAEFPIEWEEGERELFWIYDDLHIPNPVSPMFFDIGGWWLTCDHMFRRFGTPFASDWIAKEINGYVYTAAVPADAGIRSEAAEYQARYVPRVPRDPGYPGKIGSYLGWVLPHYAESFLDWWRDRLRPEIERNFEYLDNFDTEAASLLDLAVLLEDAIDIHDRHWKIHWMLNFAQFASTQALNATIEQVRGEADPALMGRLQSSLEDRNWDSIEDLWKMKEEIKGIPSWPPPSRPRPPATCAALWRDRSAGDGSSTTASSRTRRASATRQSGRTSSPSGPGARTLRRFSRPCADTSPPTTTTRRTSRPFARTSRRRRPRRSRGSMATRATSFRERSTAR